MTKKQTESLDKFLDIYSAGEDFSQRGFPGKYLARVVFSPTHKKISDARAELFHTTVL